MRLRPPSEQALLPRISERRAEVRAHNETAFLEAYRSTIKAEAQVLEAKPLQNIPRSQSQLLMEDSEYRRARRRQKEQLHALRCELHEEKAKRRVLEASASEALLPVRHRVRVKEVRLEPVEFSHKTNAPSGEPVSERSSMPRARRSSHRHHDQLDTCSVHQRSNACEAPAVRFGRRAVLTKMVKSSDISSEVLARAPIDAALALMYRPNVRVQNGSVPRALG